MRVKVLCFTILVFILQSGTLQAAVYSEANCDWCNLQWPYNFEAEATSPTIYGQIYVAGLTDFLADPSLILAEVGYGPHLSNPLIDDTQWVWASAAYNNMFPPGSNNYEYMGEISFTDPGTFSYTFRYSIDNGATWALADIDGTLNGIDVNQFGVATITVGTGAPVPVPGAVWMFVSGFLGIAGLKRKLKSKYSS